MIIARAVTLVNLLWKSKWWLPWAGKEENCP